MAATAQRFNPVALRLGFGIILIVHGLGRFNIGPFASEAGVGGFAQFLGGPLGVPVPLFFAWVVTIVEVLGGLLILVGLFTRYAAALAAIDMFVAMTLFHLPRGFSAYANAGYEYTMMLTLVGIALVLSGPGALSLEVAIFDRELLPAPIGAALGVEVAEEMGGPGSD